MGRDYDAILFLSFGGPEGMDDVMPFLANVLRGKNVPESRMKEVAHHYEMFGGVSPINAQNRKMIARLEEELERRQIKLPVYFGNRNWHPMLADTLKQMEADGVKRALAFVTSAYSSYSGCRQYLEDIQRALSENQQNDRLHIDKLRVFFDHPLFLEANLECIEEALQQFDNLENLHLTFTAHSIPISMAQNCQYENQLLFVCRQICRRLQEKYNWPGGEPQWQLVYQSRSGPKSQPWLEPDILEHIENLKNGGVSKILVHPVGFVSDHMEIIYDLDTEARQLAESLQLQFVRSLSSGNSEHFGRLIAALIEERLKSKAGQECQIACLTGAPLPDVCPADCCAYTPTRPVQTAGSH